MLDGWEGTAFVRPAQPWLEIAEAQSWLEVAGTYVGQGVLHILFGVDHLLFVFGLLLIVKERWTLLKTITAFTIAWLEAFHFHGAISKSIATSWIVQNAPWTQRGQRISNWRKERSRSKIKSTNDTWPISTPTLKLSSASDKSFP